MDIPQEIRSKIAQMDALAEEIHDWFVNEDDNDELSITQENRETFCYALAEIQGAITQIQTDEGWI